MKKLLVISSLIFVPLLLVSFITRESASQANRLRKIYSQHPSQWPAPFVDDNVKWTELGLIPPSPIENQKDSLQNIIALGKALFFDPRLSSSGKISCATCHDPALHWTDKKEKSIGHEGATTQRNAPTILNSWVYHKLFWDGRARDLQDQAFGPIESESEMNSEMPDVIRTIRKIKGYREFFEKAFGKNEINPDRMTEAIAVFEYTIVSNKSKFDRFLEGNKKALSNSELRGLHLFRTKARCMNCHHGALMTDNQFHNIGTAGADVGLYKVTHADADSGKFKTPSLRDVMHTGPWLHDGSLKHIEAVIERLNEPAMNSQISHLIRPLHLNKNEKKDLISFLIAISAPAPHFEKPVLPQ